MSLVYRYISVSNMITLGKDLKPGTIVKYILAGIYKDENFTYARVAIIPTLKVSLLSESKAREIKCVEKLDQEYTLNIDLIGVINIDSVCAVDNIATTKGSQNLKFVFHIVKDEVLKKIACDAVFGLDAIMVLSFKLFL